MPKLKRIKSRQTKMTIASLLNGGISLSEGSLSFLIQARPKKRVTGKKVIKKSGLPPLKTEANAPTAMKDERKTQ